MRTLLQSKVLVQAIPLGGCKAAATAKGSVAVITSNSVHLLSAMSYENQVHIISFIHFIFLKFIFVSLSIFSFHLFTFVFHFSFFNNYAFLFYFPLMITKYNLACGFTSTSSIRCCVGSVSSSPRRWPESAHSPFALRTLTHCKRTARKGNGDI